MRKSQVGKFNVVAQFFRVLHLFLFIGQRYKARAFVSGFRLCNQMTFNKAGRARFGKKSGTLGKGQCQEPIMGQVSRKSLASQTTTI